MKTRVSSKGQVVLPAELRRRDGIEAGQEFEIESLGRGDYKLKRIARRNCGLVKHLLACPAKDWFKPLGRTETTDGIEPFELG
jgi:AbrB family looped-hinge helix DNA binding protein